MKEAVTKCKKGNQKIKKNNGAQKELGFRDTSTELARFRKYLYTVRRGRQQGRNSDKWPLL